MPVRCVVVRQPQASGASYDMNAAFMSFQPHESGIHAVWPGCWRGQGDGSPFAVHAAAVARRGQSGSPYDWLLAIAGLTYLLAVAWFRSRG